MYCTLYDSDGQNYLSSPPVLGEANRRPFKGRQAVGGVYKKRKHAMSHLPHPLTLQAFATRSLPLKQGESLNTTEPHRFTHQTKIKSGSIKLNTLL